MVVLNKAGPLLESGKYSKKSKFPKGFHTFPFSTPDAMSQHSATWSAGAYLPVCPLHDGHVEDRGRFLFLLCFQYAAGD